MIRAEFLPILKDEMKRRGWVELDVLLITGDAYVDHPSFGVAIIARVLEKEGFRVGIIPQPDWHSIKDFVRLGRPRLFVGITSGNLDSMLNNYSPSKRKRKRDVYSPGGVSGSRPDRAVIVYANRIREAFGKIPLIIGGIEASLRRLAHYDYWDDEVRRSILLDSRADILVYGMGERQVPEIARRLNSGENISDFKNIRGTAFTVSKEELASIKEYVEIPGFEEVKDNKKSFCEAFRLFYNELNPVKGRTIVQAHQDRFIVQLPPSTPLTTEELDAIYRLPFTRRHHPYYERFGGVPAFKTVQFSITSHRGCFGNCSFCALMSHQGRIVQSRSAESILNEAREFTRDEDFKGIISDIGGPTANMYMMGARSYSHVKQLDMLKRVRELPGIKKVCISSGVRYDLILTDKTCNYLEELCKHYISGQLKIAPEHISDKVLSIMNKPSSRIYQRFIKKYEEVNKRLGKKQYLVQYFISSHPGCTLDDMVELAEYMRDMGYFQEQVQDFTPTPMTLSTCIYWTGMDPFTGKEIHCARNEKERAMQRALLQYKDRDNHRLVMAALKKCNRLDLIGKGKRCLISNYPSKCPGET